MENLVFTINDLIQISLFIAACYGCYRAGIDKGVSDTLEFLESEGHIEFEPEEK